MKVLVVGNYSENYARNKILFNLFEQLPFKFYYFNLKRYSILRLYVFIRRKGPFDVVYIPYLSHLYAILIRLFYLFVFFRKPFVVMDAFYSLYNTVVEDRRDRITFLYKVYYFLLELFSYIFSSRIIIDTEEHKKYISKRYKIRRSKIFVFPICADDVFVFCRKQTTYKDTRLFSICFHGSYVPLQGVEKIVFAAKFVRGAVFYIIGRGGRFEKRIKRSLDIPPNVVFVDFLPPKDLRKFYCENCDVCLGIFGDTFKSMLVVPNKIYECASMGFVIITGNKKAVKNYFGKEVILTSSDPKDIARTIQEVLKNYNKYKMYSHRVNKKYREICDKKRLKNILATILRGV